MDTTASIPVPRTLSAPQAAQAHAALAPRPRVRYLGVDLARFLAIAGMMATHLIAVNAMNPTASAFEQGAAQIAQTLTSGIAAPLFAVLGGLSAVFATRRLLREGRVGAAIAAVALRGAILILIGLLLGLIVSPVVVVLAYYGVAMILIAPLVAAPSWVLATLAIAFGIAGGPLNALARGALGLVNEGGSVTFEPLFADPLGALRALLLTGEYPAITWGVYLLAGMLMARLLVSATARNTLGRAAGAVAAAGAAVAIAAQLASNWALAHLSDLGFTPVPGIDPEMFRTLLTAPTFGAPFSSDLWAQLVATPHSGSPMDLLRTIGIAGAVIGILVLLCDARGEARGGARTGGALEVLRCAGAAPLTVYTLHIVATGLLLAPVMEDPAVLENGIPWWAAGTGAFALQLAGVLVIGAILAALGRRGPLEALTSGAVRLAVRG